VLGFHWCARYKMCVLAGSSGGHSYSASYKPIPWVTIMRLLHIDSSVLGQHSVSRQLSAAIVERLRATTPALDHHLSRPDRDAAVAFVGPTPRRCARRRAARRAARRRRLEPGRARRVSLGRHRRARRAHVQFHHPEPAQGLDRPYLAVGKTSNMARRARKAWRATSA